MMDGLLDILRWIFLFGCVLPTVVTLALAFAAFYFGRRWVEDFVAPDVSKLHTRLDTMKAKSPKADDADLIRKVIHEQAVKCGVVGAITGFGGFVTLPIALPIDMLLSARYQASMVSFIAQTYGYNSDVENKIATYAVMTGGTQISQVTNRAILKYAPKFFGKLSSKIIPIIGAITAFAVNYMLTRSMGATATRIYTMRTKAEVLNASNESPVTA